MVMVLPAFSTILLEKSVAEVESEIPEWGFYVYMAGDNTLSEEVDDDINEMKLIGSNDNLEIVVLADKNLNNDSHAYHVLQHRLEETSLKDINSSWNQELDMGSGETLKDFLKWASVYHPAKKKILVIWNHGSGWEKVAEDKNNHLIVPEIRESIEEYREETGDPPLTLIGFDACLMGMFEIAYELREQTEMVHGSEAYEPLEGWTYNHLLYKLNKETTNSELAFHVVNDYVESYRNGSVFTGYSVTSAVVDARKMDMLWNDLDNFSEELNSILPVYRDEISYSRNETQRYDQNPNYRDLYDLSTNIEKHIPLYEIKQKAKELQDSINNSVIAEDHWQKCIKIGDVDEDCKLPVDRAHGLTIYFPPEGPKKDYSKLKINENQWYGFVVNYSKDLELNTNITNINHTTVDTGTGTKDSVLVNGSYSGNASNVEIRLLDYNGNLVREHYGDVSQGSISNISLRPNKSGNYSLEIGLYGNEGFLRDCYFVNDIFIDLRLPDLSVNNPRIMIKGTDEEMYQVSNVEGNDNFTIEGDIQNLGTVASDNVSVLINNNISFKFRKIEPYQKETWILKSEDILEKNNFAVGQEIIEYKLNISVISEDKFEIDENNNFTEYSFYIFKEKADEHNYTVNSKNKNLIEIIQNQNEAYEFSWLESYIYVTNNELQAWDFITIEAEVPTNWSFESDSFMHLSEESKILAKIRPPLNTESGEYRIAINLRDKNGLMSGNGEITVKVPQYYGVGISSHQIENEVIITVNNNGNGKDSFKLNKSLENGLTLYLTETYFELDSFETISIKGIGIKTNDSKEYEATFTVESIGNSNITAEVVMKVKEKSKSEDINDWGISILIATLIVGGITYTVYQRRIQ